MGVHTRWVDDIIGIGYIVSGSGILYMVLVWNEKVINLILSDLMRVHMQST